MGGPQDKPVEPLVELLTRREREILGLLAEGLSAPEIAAHLTLAVSSVKWHIQQLYGKLGVNSKQRAILRAGELGLLGTDHSAVPAAPHAAEPQASPAPRHNLPLQVSRFFGREAEIALLKARLAEHRLVTLAGSGGVGKTRLSLQAAEELLVDFSDGVWFAALAPLTDPGLVTQTVAAALGLRVEPGQPIFDALIDFLRPRQALLVLDNCEHLLPACAALADGLLRACSRLKILASSREPLGIDGEAVLAVPSLPFPAAGQSAIAGQLAGYPAVRLFIDRARLVLPAYQLTPDNVPAIARICQRLDGIPLAIEMAAARMSLLGAAQLADRLDDAFRLLTGGSRAALPRQQTLRATLDWSYRLLDEAQRRLLQRLSVFAGGCTLEAAEAVCAGDGLEAGEVLDVLGALVAKSMVIADRPPGQTARYHLLETVRQYAREKLNDAGETARLHKRHRDYFLAFAETHGPKVDTPQHAIWRPKLGAEQDNLRQALEWSFSSDEGEAEAGPRLALTVRYFPSISYQEELDWDVKAFAVYERHADLSARHHIEILRRAAVIASVTLNDASAAVPWINQAIDISRSLGPEGREPLMRNLLALAQFFFDDLNEVDRALAPMAEAEAILQALGPGYYAAEEGLRVSAFFASHRARIALVQGKYETAKQHAAECIRLYELSDSRWQAAMGYITMGVASANQGEYPEAQQHFLAAVAIEQESGRPSPFYTFFWLSLVEFHLGNLAEALQNSRNSLRLAAVFPARNYIALNLALLAVIRAKQGRPAEAARLAGASEALDARQKRKQAHDLALDLIPSWREGLEPAAVREAFEAGKAMTTDEAVALALAGDADPRQPPEAADMSLTII